MSAPDHIPAPLAHRPNVVSYTNGQVGMSIQEQGNDVGWMYSDVTVEVRQ